MSGSVNDREIKKVPLEVDEQELPAVADTIVDGPANPLFGDAIFICVDFEGRQGRYKDSYRIVVTVSDTRRLHGLNIKLWRASGVHSPHFRILAWSTLWNFPMSF